MIPNGIPRAGDIPWQIFVQECNEKWCHDLTAVMLGSSFILGPIVAALWMLINGKPLAPDGETTLVDDLYFQTFHIVVTHPYYVVMILRTGHGTGAVRVILAIVNHADYTGFFTGVIPRLLGTVLFYTLVEMVCRASGLKKRYARTTLEGITMITRDVILRIMVHPLYNMSTEQIRSFNPNLS